MSCAVKERPGLGLVADRATTGPVDLDGPQAFLKATDDFADRRCIEPRLLVEALRWEEHIDLENGWVFVPGTKTAGSYRKVPLPTPLAEYFRSTPVKSGRVVELWPNVERDLAAACGRAGIARATPNDLRRTYAS